MWNTIPYKAIAEELSRQGFSCDYKQCREKVKALKKKYKEVMDAQRRSGTGISSDNDSFKDVPIVTLCSRGNGVLTASLLSR